MANYELVFFGTETSGTLTVTLKCYKNEMDEIYIELNDRLTDSNVFISLDKSTAIKLSKTLRTEINKITNHLDF
jgi:hypothetical protein